MTREEVQELAAALAVEIVCNETFVAVLREIRRELLESRELRGLVRDITLSVVLEYDALAQVQRVRNIVRACEQRGVKLYRSKKGTLCQRADGKPVPDDLKPIIILHRDELLNYLARRSAVEKAADEIRNSLGGKT